MSRVTCKHGVELYGSRMCTNCIEEGRNETLRVRRSEWIRNSVCYLPYSGDPALAVGVAEDIADELVRRGYL